jgi:hypothetical protein
MLVETDREKYAIPRILDFYDRQPTDFSDYFQAAWRYKNRAALGQPKATLASVAAEMKLSPRYLPMVWQIIEEPAQGSSVAGPVRIQGWAADPRATIASGVDAVEVYLDGEVTTRGVPLGEITYGDLRQDVGAALGGDNEAARGRSSRTGFTFNWNPTTVPVGTHYLTFYARGPDGAVARSLALEVTSSSVVGARTVTPGAGIVAPRPATGGLSLAVGPTTANSVAPRNAALWTTLRCVITKIAETTAMAEKM